MVLVWLAPPQPGSRPMAPYQLPEPRLPDMLQAEKQGKSQESQVVPRVTFMRWGSREAENREP